ncbi:MAG: iron-sulfur cluster repair di-iron protein [Phycisphaerales bacterium]|nr:iron-sulfur cluster repair di-iron protein [Phycisphaerales bacterium]
MTSQIDTQTTVGQLVTQRPARSRFFESLGIDYCCGGKMPLEEACRKKGLDPHTVAVLLASADARAAEHDRVVVNPDAMALAELADHIEQTHHAYLRVELPRLDQMTEKVFRVHGEHEPRLADVRRAFTALNAELTQHMMKEERILFPIIRQLEQPNGQREFHCGSVANPIRQMEAEHQHAGDALAIMREATDGYQPPEWACNTYRAMLDGLAQLERDMHQHVHKENNILFPKAIELEAAR